MPRKSPVLTFSLSPASHAILEKQKALYGGNASKGLNAALREFAEVKGWYDVLGTQPSTLDKHMRIEIVPASGSPCRQYFHNGEIFAEAPATGNYVIRLTNTLGKRVEAVLSVDGIDALNGKDANLSNRGWMLEPYQTLDVKGWFRTHAEAAAFTFETAGSGAGYAEKTGRGTANVGVIGVAVFEEKEPDFSWTYSVPAPATPSTLTWNTGHITRSSMTYGSSLGARTKGLPIASVDVTCSTENVPSSNVATGYGARTEMHSVGVSFTRASSLPVEIVTLRYATRELLQSWGVPLTPVPPRANPFPGGMGVPAPSGWTG